MAEYTFQTLHTGKYSQETDVKGESFISTNIMDCFHSYQNRFTANQYSRVRHVLGK